MFMDTLYLFDKFLKPPFFLFAYIAYIMACSKIFSGDLPELMHEILQYFRNDYSMLHSCIFVNRLWCRLAIPLLWEDPFSIAAENDNYYLFTESYKHKNYRFIEIYLHNLNENDKTKLNEYGISENLFPSNTLFNYPSFIKCLNTQNISFSIEEWVEIVRASAIKGQHHINFLIQNTNSQPNFDLNSRRFIFLLLFKIFIRNNVNLHTFEVEIANTLNTIEREYFNSVFELILQNPTFIGNIKNLKLFCNGQIADITFLQCFYFNCNSISSLYFQFSGNNDNKSTEQCLSQIINSQQNLRKILFEDNEYPLNSLKNSNCSNTLKTIIFHNINFRNINTLKEIFEQLNVLESIHILYCLSLNLIIKQIIHITKPFKLKSLFMNETSQIETMQSLLQKSGDYLENIGFELSISNEMKEKLLKLIKKYCTKIKFFKLHGYDNQNIYSAFDLIRNNGQNLNYISINFCKFLVYDHHRLSDDNELSSIILQNLGQILPFRLEYLNLSLKINTSDLEVFLKNSKNTFINKLLIRNKMLIDSEDILPCIKKYIMKEKRVKYLAIEEVFLDKREELYACKNEVKEFKSYNIEVHYFDDLDIQVCDFIKGMD
ncbi:hypothetical protein C1645_866561 [Glomus cerebriforme]|uniref:F-box domain-containing protein n=1 Tax=Glomus cerebriforme TaxID=658196 RepID=A0A397S8D9_9GLOM|nr:hypothetical protein C1645_866561 [Glomus cerebriforme]